MDNREQTTIRLPVELKRQLHEEAVQKGYSLNTYMLMLINKGRQCLR